MSRSRLQDYTFEKEEYNTVEISLFFYHLRVAQIEMSRRETLFIYLFILCVYVCEGLACAIVCMRRVEDS